MVNFAIAVTSLMIVKVIVSFTLIPPNNNANSGRDKQLEIPCALSNIYGNIAINKSGEKEINNSYGFIKISMVYDNNE